jgi:quercetin dioxygenase-like cupin family protein
MRVVRIAPAGRKPNPGDIFIGDVVSQTVVGDESPHLRVAEHTFLKGARNKLHVHATDQVLLVTAGDGTLGGDGEEHDLAVGDVAVITAGERHWHGAKPGHDMTHWSILGPGKTQIVG